MSAVRRIVETHDWNIEAADGTSGGVRFEITGVGRCFDPSVGHAPDQ